MTLILKKFFEDTSVLVIDENDLPWAQDVTQLQQDVIDLNNNKADKLQNNLVATTDPTATNDSSEWYEPLSVWINNSTNEIFKCLSNSVWAAVWVKTTLTLDELWTMALESDAPTDWNIYWRKDWFWEQIIWWWLSWWDSITSTSWTWITTTIWNSASTWTIGQSITAWNTQTNAVTLLNLDTWTSALQTLTALNVIYKSWKSHSWLYTWWIRLNSFSAGTNAISTQVEWMVIWQNFNNSTAAHQTVWIVIYNEANTNVTSAYHNTWISILNYSTKLSIWNWEYTWSWLSLNQIWQWWTVLHIQWSANINSSTNWLVNYTLSNSQSWATVMQKIDTGTSAQGHKAHQILLRNNSTSARWIEVNTSSTWTWIPIELITTWTDRTALKLSTWFTSASAPVWASTYINVDIWWVAYRILAQAVA